MVGTHYQWRVVWRISIDIHHQGLHELDPVFHKVTLENPSFKAVARDLRFHHDPAGRWPLSMPRFR